MLRSNPSSTPGIDHQVERSIPKQRVALCRSLPSGRRHQRTKSLEPRNIHTRAVKDFRYDKSRVFVHSLVLDGRSSL
jgi:hypothetical protein